NEIRELTLESTAPALIREEANIIKRSLRDVYTRDITDVLVEGDEGYRAAKDLMKILIPSHAKKVQPYKDSTVPLFSRYHIETQLESMIGREVKLKSGGYIVIDSTEALVAIDVNSGRATRGRNIEETALKTNLEAANEVARQIRLRDLAGLIVIDFIDMDFHRNQTSVERRLKEAMHRDRAKIQIGRISPFGLLELSRQRMRPSITETTTDTCPNCGGSGIRRSTESTALHVLRGIEEDGVRYKDSEIEVNVPTEVALYMLNYKREALAEIEKKHEFKIIISENNTLIPPQFTLVQHGAPAPHQTDKVKQNGTKLEEDREPAGNETKKRKRRRPRRRNKGIAATDSSPSNTKPAEDISANSFEKDSVEANEPNNETPKKRRRVRHKKSAMNQTKNVNSSELESTPPAVAAENDAALSKANDNVKTNSTETDYLNPEKHSPVTKRPDGNSNVTIVGTDDQVKNTDDTRRGWWQKLAD
ncbi:MAG: ribonuclease E/G, partial [Pseudomonadales bacterium]|nr:ribonuclease E/G [Pseudomonadales bacterium]